MYIILILFPIGMFAMVSRILLSRRIANEYERVSGKPICQIFSAKRMFWLKEGQPELMELQNTHRQMLYGEDFPESMVLNRSRRLFTLVNRVLVVYFVLWVAFLAYSAYTDPH